MKFHSRLTAPLLVTAAIAITAVILPSGVIVPSIVMALSGVEVSEIAKKITVLIDTQNPGSGVIVAKEKNNYYVLTAWHVMRYSDWQYTIKTSDGKSYPLDYSTVKRLPGVDLAIMEFSSNDTYMTAKLGNSDRALEGTPVYIAGFPNPGAGIEERIYRFTSGEISGRFLKPKEGGYALVYTNTTRTGFSGGPVLDSEGHLVGIHGQGETSQSASNESGEASDSKTGFNMGIPIKTFLNLVSKTGMKLAVQVENSPSSEATSNNSPTLTAPQLPETVRPANNAQQPICAGRRCL
ncbi:MAG: hypothetical protein N4J56_008011 [Chroococcidiopsis sp. SAG 2025]|uniref:S1 family peptidase n=1 Tax=Chroococcidiopsis sp. SAG 2025 TaxID=171389 RepID=UPI0029371E93|nr:serine protease [Chroococcidiopsis sp. SAG 2025]MDV2998306.1 hypothetical protein [Chroococcidiopsis sp. SAG 2025]